MPPFTKTIAPTFANPGRNVLASPWSNWAPIHKNTASNCKRHSNHCAYTLNEQPFIAGVAPAFADYIVFGALQWARCVSPMKLLTEDDSVYAWRKRLLDYFEGMAGKAMAREI